MNPGRLNIGHDGRVKGPTTIKYNSPFPCVNGSFGSGAMMGVVMHTMAGNLPGTTQLFNDPARQVSAHFGIAQDGEIWQYGPIGKQWEAWHAVSANKAWYGIEHADDGNPENPLTQAQVAASAQLVELLSRFAGFPLQVTNDVSVKGYATHQTGGAAWNPDSHTCPGPGPRAGQRAEIVKLAKLIRHGDPLAAGPHHSNGSESLALLADRQGSTPAAILYQTARNVDSFGDLQAAYIDEGRWTAKMPGGMVLWLP
jgi:hypothetical protein